MRAVAACIERCPRDRTCTLSSLRLAVLLPRFRDLEIVELHDSFVNDEVLCSAVAVPVGALAR